MHCIEWCDDSCVTTPPWISYNVDNIAMAGGRLVELPAVMDHSKGWSYGEGVQRSKLLSAAFREFERK